MNYLLDSCVLSELVKARPEPCVLEWIATTPEARLYLSVLTLGERQKGIVQLHDGERRKKLIRWLDEAVRVRFERRILGLDEESLLEWGRLAGESERKGRILPVIDGLFAASAFTRHMTLVTRNLDDVKNLGVPLLNPWDSAG